MLYRVLTHCDYRTDDDPCVVELSDKEVLSRLSDRKLMYFCRVCEDGGCLREIE